MEITTILAVAGILVSLLFGAWGVYLALKRRYPGQITFLQETSIALFDEIVKNLPELKVLYKDQLVGEGLVLLKGALLNTGSKDITPEMVAENITMSVPECYKWITAKLVAHSPKMQCSIDVKPQALIFNTGLLRCNEYLRFEALAEVPIKKKDEHNHNQDAGERLKKIIKFNHRIADTQKIISDELMPITRGKRQLKRFASMVGVAVLGLIVMVFIPMIQGWPAKVQYRIPSESGEIEVKADYKIDGNVRLKGIKQKDYKKIMSVEEFFNIPRLTPYLVPERERKIQFIVMSLYVLLPLVMCIYAYREQRKARRLSKLLGVQQ